MCDWSVSTVLLLINSASNRSHQVFQRRNKQTTNHRTNRKDIFLFVDYFSPDPNLKLYEMENFTSNNLLMMILIALMRFKLVFHRLIKLYAILKIPCVYPISIYSSIHYIHPYSFISKQVSDCSKVHFQFGQTIEWEMPTRCHFSHLTTNDILEFITCERRNHHHIAHI